MISVIVPTYKEPEALDLCLESLIKGQQHKNQILVVVDGFYDLNKEVLEKYAEHIDILDLEENVGLSKATNLGVYNSSFDKILIINDDNVASKNWDVNLLEALEPNSVVTPNQIEPTKSIYLQFVQKDLGRSIESFSLEEFWRYENEISKDKVEETGSTLPIFMFKVDYLRVGGWDESYPGAWVVDLDFFLKCTLSGMKMLRTYKTHFYHFGSLGTEATPSEKQQKIVKEQACHEYCKYKWGGEMKYNPLNNIKMI
jgi:glycosyltransferase involved in cell wall biosynthesis